MKQRCSEGFIFKEEDNVRTPIHWNDEDHAGFTSASPWIKVNPNYKTINVQAAEIDLESPIHFFRTLTAYRKANLVLAYGNFKDLYPNDPHLYVFTRIMKDESIIACYNFSNYDIDLPSDLDLGAYEMDISNLNSSKISQLMPWEGRVYKKR